MGMGAWRRVKVVSGLGGLVLPILLIVGAPGYAQTQVVCQTPIGWCFSITPYPANGAACGCLAGTDVVGGQSLIPQLAPLPYLSPTPPPDPLVPPDLNNGSGAPAPDWNGSGDSPLINPTKPWPCPTGYAC